MHSICGIYAIVNLVTGRRYIGSSIDITKRWLQHTCGLNRGVKCNSNILQDWKQLGKQSFGFIILEEVSDRALLIEREQWHLDRTENPYNIADRAGSGPKVGFRHTQESIEKMRVAHKGKAKSAAHKAAISAWRKGRSFPKHAAALRGRKLSLETREKMRLSHIGRVKSPETRAKLSAALKGRVITPEWRAKISATKRQKVA